MSEPKSHVWLSHPMMSFLFTKWQWSISRNMAFAFTFPISNTTDDVVRVVLQFLVILVS